jgi:hypothetical protein
VRYARVRRLKFHVIFMAADGPGAAEGCALAADASSGGVPRKEEASNGLQRPKSVRRTWPSLPMRRLSGFMSRWM